MKSCSKCKQIKEFSEFHKNKESKTGYNYRCKDCSADATREWKRKPERRQQIREYVRGYRAKETSKARRREREKHYHSTNTAHHMFLQVRARCKHSNIGFTLTEEDIVIPKYCPVLGVELTYYGDKWHVPSVDRINPNGIYEKGNIIIMSMRANALKSNGSLEEFKKLVEFLETLPNVY